ncbi:adenosylcobinamide-GDP ribazoletransferase [Dorea sp. AF36-15AT]|uniref:adenosylcobinamide-GDP ribazoletransferase n=1 Tax=Dorea sp. AF36-15AT TaxID=2292041 RepID=UPI000E54683B|nr:adenosylcobinamide-GDP ribazoletransferase [Dorea sp. AF36-15AT]RHP07839.1 adenosylcobinamide-GDP ribazoletransferase [Dorea sp. AF36-15AT]
MSIINSFFIALSMYSRIPVPRVDWEKENMRYAMCFFPMIGVVIGVVMYLAGWLLDKTSVGGLFRGVVFTLIPIIITGGIHMDGFMDTMDALGSWGDREKKLEILKDSHAGAFAILGMGCYLMWSVAVWSELPAEVLRVCGVSFVLSRALSGFSVVTFPAARNSGLLKMFQDGAQKKVVRITMCLYVAAAVIMMAVMNARAMTGAVTGVMIAFLYYIVVSRKQFGGVTGDLAGFFLETAELAMFTGILVTCIGR